MPQSDQISDQIKVIYRGLLSLSIYRGVLKRPVTAALLEILGAACHRDSDAVCSGWGKLNAILAQSGQLDSLPAAVAGEVLTDENIFVSQMTADRADENQELTESIVHLAKRDLRVLYSAVTMDMDAFVSSVQPELAGCLPAWGRKPASAPLDQPWDECIDGLGEYHRLNGCGSFVLHSAFLWRNGRMHPVEHPDPIRLSDLKDYEYQRRIAIDNTRAFLDGFEANNMLLYGDRGTGKSSTVKALLNEYAGEGLRMIEMPKEFLRELPDLSGRLARVPMKFIIFIDDLSFSDNDDNFAALKAVLEGGLASRPRNVVIYATSNRRHLLRETFSDRSGDEVHHADTVQEAVSLSDRFGIFLTFLMPDKQHFLDIVAQIANDKGIKVERQKLLDAAERWALERGGRSPRYARQFIADLQARLSRGGEI